MLVNDAMASPVYALDFAKFLGNITGAGGAGAGAGAVGGAATAAYY